MTRHLLRDDDLTQAEQDEILDLALALKKDRFKLKALDNMSQTIGVLETEVEKSKSYLDRVQKHDARNAAGALDLNNPSI